MALKKEKFGQEDIIERRKNNDDLCWSLRHFNPTSYKHGKFQDSDEIKKIVYESPRVKFTISQIAKESGEDEKNVEKRAKEILDEMSHHLRMHTIRSFGFILSKLMRQLFSAINVNRDGIEKLRAAVEEHPVVYMPTHRSYVDFLLLSYVCFTYGLPVPVIAAGTDFMGMGGMNSIMRCAGAFFIRRSFVSDKLYWNLFSEYVQVHVRNGSPPIEFFVEGTRSRSGKSLVPKLGFLSSVVEPFFKSELTDVVIAPVSISYDRTLEESLFAYELLGVPKPPETTKGLFKARQILSQNYGMINFNVSEPILLNDFCKMKMCRRVYHNGPKLLFSLSAEEQNLCKDLAYHVVRAHQTSTVVSPFTLIASILLTYLQMGISCIPLREFGEKLSWLKHVIIHFNGRICWREGDTAENVIKDSISVHGSIIELKSHTKTTELFIQPVQVTNRQNVSMSNLKLKGHRLSDVTVSNAVPSMLLSHYNNQIIHLIIRPALLAVVLDSKSSCDKSYLYEKYNFLEKLLSYDFIFKPGETENAFADTLKQLESINVIACHDNMVQPLAIHDHLFKYLLLVIDPFLVSYKVIYHVIVHLVSLGLTLTIRLIVQYAQACVEQLLLKRCVTTYTSLSLDLLNNSVMSLVQMKYLEKDNGNLRLNESFHSIAANLDQLIRLPINIIKDHLSQVVIDMPAKL